MLRIAILFALISGTVLGKELTFYFDIYSSGPMIYACNAGIRHHRNSCKQYCHLAGKPAIPEYTCKPGEHNCVCTGTNGGAYLMDFMRFNYNKWNGGAWTSQSYRGSAKASSNNVYNEIRNVSGNQNIFATKLNQVNFNLGSEQYGAEFFVDICFRGSQIDYYNPDKLLDVATSNLAKAAMTVTDVTALSPNHPVGPGGVPGTFQAYLKLSGLKSKAVLVCDVQGHGRFRYAHNGPAPYQGQYDTLDHELNLTPNNEMKNKGVNYVTQSRWIRPSASSQVLINNWINVNNSNHPRFCVVRYYFQETTCADRAWQRHDARVCLFTSIEEAAVEN